MSAPRDPSERFASAAEVRELLETTQRIFVQAGGGIEKMALDSNRVLVASSFVRVKTKATAFARDIYDRLFARAPEVRDLFPQDMSAQEKKLLHMIEVAIDALSAPESLDALLADLGRRHVHYGAKDERFSSALVGAARDPRQQEGDAWTAELAAAWKHTLDLLEQRMRRGMQLEKATQVSVAANGGNVLRARPPMFGERRSAPGPRSWKPPSTHYARSGEVDLAYQVFGVGPVDLVVLLGWISHVELNWGHPALMGFLDQLGRSARVLTYDKRGTASSESDA